MNILASLEGEGIQQKRQQYTSTAHDNIASRALHHHVVGPAVLSKAQTFSVRTLKISGSASQAMASKAHRLYARCRECNGITPFAMCPIDNYSSSFRRLGSSKIEAERPTEIKPEILEEMPKPGNLVRHQWSWRCLHDVDETSNAIRLGHVQDQLLQ